MKENPQRQSCELNFIQGLTEEQPKTASQIALRRGGRRAAGVDTVWAGEYVQSGTHLSGSCGDRRAQFMLLVLFCVWEDVRIWVH